jgi:hypothetical protein
MSESEPTRVHPFLAAFRNPDGAMVVMVDNNEFDAPGIWGIVVADIVQHVVNAYVRDGFGGREVRESILEMLISELENPSEKARGLDGEWTEEGFVAESRGGDEDEWDDETEEEE